MKRLALPLMGTSLVLALAACKRDAATDTHTPPVTAVAPSASAAPSAAATASAARPAAANVCAFAQPPLVVPTKTKSQDFRVGALGAKVLVTWLEPPNDEGGGRRALGRVLDGASLGPEVLLDSSQYGDVIMSGNVPVVLGGVLTSIACLNYAPTGEVSCYQVDPGGKPKPMFKVKSLNFGQQGPGLAVVTSGKDAALMMPHGDVTMLSTRAGGPARTHNRTQTRDVEALVATSVSDDELVVAYRVNGALYARRAGWDEKWRGPAIMISEKGMLVGAPAVVPAPYVSASAASILFSTRKTAKDPWQIVVATLDAANVVRAPLDVGGAESQGPSAVPIEGRCSLISWVEGSGTSTITRVAPRCDGKLDRERALTLSAAGVEGGRAVLARSESTTFAAWQEFPKGSPAQLKVAPITCP